MLIGVGFHARRIYIPTLQKLSADHQIELAACVDIHEQKPVVDEYMEKSGFSSIEMVYVRSGDVLDLKDKGQLNKMVRKYNIQGVIISTEPLAHKMYAEWALQNNLSILMDKPVTTRKLLGTSEEAAAGLCDDYQDLLTQYKRIQKKKSTVFIINTQRRYDAGFQKVIELITEARDAFGIPVTSIQALYADGTWVHPNEILEQHSHPYLHGYGKCSHSGYHIFDIIWQFYNAGRLPKKQANSLEVFSSFVSPAGYSMQISYQDFKAYFGKEFVLPKVAFKRYQEIVKNYGEIDASSIVRLLRDGENICNVSINMMHNSFSRRAWGRPNGDLYKGNGRVKHQQFIIQQGPFQSLHIHNYQSSDTHDVDNSDQFAIGGNNHFDIYVFRNAQMFGIETPLQIISNKDLQEEVSNRLTIEQTKDLVLLEFIGFLGGHVKKESIISNIDTHKVPVQIMSAVYQSHARQGKGKNPIVKMPL